MSETVDQIEQRKRLYSNVVQTLDDAVARLTALEAERDKLLEAVRAAGALLRQVPRQINDSFGAGMEEREGGSWRRQGKLLDQTRAFEAETKEWLAKHGGTND